MTVQLVAMEVSDFLKSPEPQIICIFGKWGVGKTFAWNHYLKQAQAGSRIAFDRYAYVSMFGRNSVAEVRDAIVEATVDSRVPGILPSLASFDELVGSAFKVLRTIKPLFPLSSKAVGVGDSASRLLYLAVKKQIVCFDDLERAGEKLRIADILGLASELKEQKCCKVVLLLNLEELPEQEKFQQQLEKVADVAIAFAPTPSEAAEIAVPDDYTYVDDIRAACVQLSVVNIRVIRKALRLARKVEFAVPHADPRILKQAVRTLALGSFAKYQPTLAPPLAFIRDYHMIVHAMNRPREEPEADAKFAALLNSFDFSHADDLDNLLFDAIETGVLDEKRLYLIVEQQHATLRSGDLETEFRATWRPYHDSFSNNEAEVLGGMEAFVQNNIQVIRPYDLSSVSKLMRELGHEERADALVDKFLAEKQAPPSYWKVDDYGFASELDPRFRQGCDERFRKEVEKVSPERILSRMALERGWNPEELTVLAEATPDDFYRLFTSPMPEGGERRDHLITAALKLGEFVNAEPHMLEIGRRASAAVRRIASESLINRLRTKRYKLVPLEDAPPEDR